MRVIPFPADQPLPGEREWLAELESALSGEAQGAAAAGVRELREDVRSLAPEMDPEFAAQLAGRLAAGSVHGAGPQRRRRTRLARLRTHRRGALGGALASAAVLVAVLLLAGSGGPSTAVPAQRNRASETAGSNAASSGVKGFSSSPGEGAKLGEEAQAAPSAQTSAPSASASAPAGAAAPGRVQQLGASVTLSTAAEDVQAVADQVGALSVRLGGYVQSSQVQTQAHGNSEGTLALRLPSTRLGAALAAIGRLAPVRAENQSLQDITGSYEAARRQLSDAVAERSALLRALAAATEEGQIDSLRERLAQARSAITRAQGELDAVSRRAGTAEVEVTILGDAHASNTGEGLTVHRALRDAGRVLLVTLAAILILAAALIPLALLAACLLAASRAARRRQRERALDPS
jgi:hypothetical protein